MQNDWLSLLEKNNVGIEYKTDQSMHGMPFEKGMIIHCEKTDTYFNVRDVSDEGIATIYCTYGDWEGQFNSETNEMKHYGTGGEWKKSNYEFKLNRLPEISENEDHYAGPAF